MIRDFSGNWNFDINFLNSQKSIEPIEKTKEVLRMAMKNGEVISVIYNGGSTPGKLREIFPINFSKGFTLVSVRCLPSQAVKTLNIGKIQIIGNYPSLDYSKALASNNLNDWFNLLIPNQRMPWLRFDVSSSRISVFEEVLIGGKVVNNEFVSVTDIGKVDKKFVIDITGPFSTSMEFNKASDAMRFLIHMLETADYCKKEIASKSKSA